MTSTDPRTGARVSSEAVTSAFPPVSFADLVATVPGATIRGDAAVPLTDVAFDSREVAPGALFFCVPGRHVDGHAFAAGRWMPAPPPSSSNDGSTWSLPRYWSRRCVGRWDRWPPPCSPDPAASMTIVGVTGTNGKTTVTYLLASIFRAAGVRPVVIGTTGARVDGGPVPLARTTPEAPDLHRLLARMRDAGVTGRGAGGLVARARPASRRRRRVRRGGFTNLSQDHLDYHPYDGGLLRGEGAALHPATRAPGRRERRRPMRSATARRRPRIRRRPTASTRDADVRATTCLDGRGVSFVVEGSGSGRGSAATSTYRTASRRSPWPAAGRRPRDRGRGSRRRPGRARPGGARGGRAGFPRGGGLRAHAG